jgi:hypothetical protein
MKTVNVHRTSGGDEDFVSFYSAPHLNSKGPGLKNHEKVDFYGLFHEKVDFFENFRLNI